jgi:hypothetical protein
MEQGASLAESIDPSKPRLPKEAFEVLEPDDGKLSRPVLRGLDLSNEVRLLGPVCPQLILRKSAEFFST